VQNARRLMWCAAVIVALCLGAGVPAFAQTAAQPTYTGVTPPQLGSQQSSGAAAVQVAVPNAPRSQLPFTGSDVIELAGVGVGLIGVGAVLRRSGRARRRQ
jgi:hypothetical protein